MNMISDNGNVEGANSNPVVGEGRIWDGYKWIRVSPTTESMALSIIFRQIKEMHRVFDDLYWIVKPSLKGGTGNQMMMHNVEKQLDLLKKLAEIPNE